MINELVADLLVVVVVVKYTGVVETNEPTAFAGR